MSTLQNQELHPAFNSSAKYKNKRKSNRLVFFISAYKVQFYQYNNVVECYSTPSSKMCVKITAILPRLQTMFHLWWNCMGKKSVKCYNLLNKNAISDNTLSLDNKWEKIIRKTRYSLYFSESVDESNGCFLLWTGTIDSGIRWAVFCSFSCLFNFFFHLWLPQSHFLLA